MKQVDMSAKAVTARLKLVSELRRLSLSLQKAKLPAETPSAKTTERESESSQSETRRTK